MKLINKKGYFMKTILFTLVAVLALSLHAEQEPITITVKPSKKSKPIKEQGKVAKNGKKIVFMVSSGNLQKAGFGFSLALGASSKGIDTTVVLGADALKFALVSGKQNLFLAKQMMPRDMLLKVMELDGVVYVSSVCAEALGVKQEDFIAGVKIVEDDEVFSKVYETDSKVLSY
jgi:predicted peroxiredoxin